MSKTKENKMVVIELGYKSYVLNNKDAISLMEILEKSELYEQVWVRPEDRGDSKTEYTHHIYENDMQVSMKLVTNDFYRIAKLAGKPDKR
jgi:predicted DNA-binding ArsR family transcriptional regulator